MALAVVGGGRRCGKSRFALALASAHGPRLGFVATFVPTDEEGRQKVEQARRERGPSFATTEEPIQVPQVLEGRGELFDAIVVDDLTAWVSNLAVEGRSDAEVEAEAERLIRISQTGETEIVIVTSDVDFGFPVDSAASSRFRRLAGFINRRMAESATRVYWMVFGIPTRIR
ncbi:MAG: bifunctional adenosylcobinamide kinase/adenosylcobinamide-phosphate guanylyltransferase [Acidobacteria bacterium]|nr:bifunctional adenosylcobinamide kinase/adenosylcobinamide-phosphate guanylyltransferase [Acidobacteriota bacterium]